MSERRWSRSDWFALVGVALSALGAVAAWVVVPGFREKVGLDPQGATTSTAASATGESPSGSVPDPRGTAAAGVSAPPGEPAPSVSTAPPPTSVNAPIATVTRPPACTSFTACVASCEAGAFMSCAASGDMALGGTDGATKDEARAHELYDRACKGDDDAGCTGRGWLELNGQGTAKNPQAALASFSRACDGARVAGCFGVGVILRGGHGVTADVDRAVAAFERACEGGNRAACKAHDQLAKK